jgi:hypothetical protein
MTRFDLLHEKALSLAKQYQLAQSKLLDVLQEIDNLKAFRHLGFGSLWDYCRLALKLSESDCSALIRVARTSHSVPELKEAVEQGLINLSAAKRVCSVIKPENKEEWLKKASELSQRELEMAIAEQQPRAVVRDRIRPLGENQLELKCALSCEAEKLLRRVQDLESKRTKQSVDLEHTLIAMANAYLQKHDPVERVKRVERAKRQVFSERFKKTEQPKRPQNLSPVRPSMPATITHAVHRRDEGQCVWTYRGGNRCQSRRFVELHHIQPLSHGGEHLAHNIATHCSAHHKAIHDGVLGHRLAGIR